MTIIIPGLPFSFEGMVTIGWIAFFLIIGAVLRTLIPFFRRYLVSACILGGCIGLLCQATGLLSATGFAPNNDLLQMMVFHLYNFTWVFMGMRIPNLVSGTGKHKSAFPKILWFSFLISLMLAVTGALGMFVTMAMQGMGLTNGPVALGRLMSSGFIAGPGQALTLGGIWEQFGHVGLKDYGLASASLGYAFSIMLGIPLLNILARKQKLKILSNASVSEQAGFYEKEESSPSVGRMTSMTNNLDVIAWHLGLALAAYLLAFILLFVVLKLMPASLIPVIWSLFFIFTLCCGILVRKFLVCIKKEHFIDNDINSRLTNTTVDFLVCGTFIGISVGNIGPYVWAFFATGISITAFVAMFMWWLCSRLDDEPLQNFAWCFGTWTGTVSTGMILLRMVDPNNKSKVPAQYGIANTLAVPVMIFLSVLGHADIVYGYSSLGLSFAFLGVSLILFIAMQFCKVEGRKGGWNAVSSESEST